MLDMSLIIMVVVLALVFDFINGFHDTANAIATCVSTRAIRPGVAIVGTAILNFLGAMISTGVAKTIGGDIVVSPTLVNEMIIIAGLVGAIIWNLLTWWVGMPSSSSHALIGGMIGAIIVSAGVAALNGWGYPENRPVPHHFTGFGHHYGLHHHEDHLCRLPFIQTGQGKPGGQQAASRVGGPHGFFPRLQ